MTLVALLDRERTRDRARPRPNAPGNFITDSRRATVYSLTLTPSPENYIKWWPYAFPLTKAFGYIDNPPLSPDWIAVGPVAPIDPVLNIAGALIPGQPGALTPPLEIPDFGVAIPPLGELSSPEPIDISIPIVPALAPENTAEGSQLVADTAHKAARTFSSSVGLTRQQIQTSEFPIRGVNILADPGNSGKIWIGYDPQVVVNNGFPLIAGAAKDLNIGNLADVWLIADTADQIFHVEYTK